MVDLRGNNVNTELKLNLEVREKIGKGLNALRAEGKIPAVIHNPGEDSIVVSGLYTDVSKIYQEAGRHHPINVKVADKSYLTIIKDVDIEPTKHQLRHVVFGAIKQNETVKTEVPIELTGDAPATKIGLIINKLLYEIEIEALPKNLPDSIVISVETLEKNDDRITVADITPPSGVTILTDIEQVIVAVEEPTIQPVEEVAPEIASVEEPAANTTSDNEPTTASQ